MTTAGGDDGGHSRRKTRALIWGHFGEFWTKERGKKYRNLYLKKSLLSKELLKGDQGSGWSSTVTQQKVGSG